MLSPKRVSSCKGVNSVAFATTFPRNTRGIVDTPFGIPWNFRITGGIWIPHGPSSGHAAVYPVFQGISGPPAVSFRSPNIGFPTKHTWYGPHETPAGYRNCGGNMEHMRMYVVHGKKQQCLAFFRVYFTVRSLECWYRAKGTGVSAHPHTHHPFSLLNSLLPRDIRVLKWSRSGIN